MYRSKINSQSSSTVIIKWCPECSVDCKDACIAICKYGCGYCGTKCGDNCYGNEGVSPY